MIDQYIYKYGKRLYGLCVTLCADAFDADDLYQETWLKALRRIEQYDPSKPFEAWLTSICVNTYRDLSRRKKRSPMFDGFTSTEDKDKAIADVSQPEKEDFSDLHDAINRLPEKLRITVILHYFHDLDEKRTAAALSIPNGTVKSRLNKAKKLLRKELDIQ
ncbi:MAG: RNA polymerase sigma factor [Ruminococcus sp.]|nr:RNA polymerase sigma factor [Ruminococcus sp.]